MTYPRQGPDHFLPADRVAPRHAAGGAVPPGPSPEFSPTGQAYPVQPPRNHSGQSARPAAAGFPAPAAQVSQPLMQPATAGRANPRLPAYKPAEESPAWHDHLAGVVGGAADTAVFSNANPARPRAVPGYRLADDLFLVALDDRNGQLRVHGDVVGPALAGALFTELTVGEWIEVCDGLVYPSAEALRGLTVPLDALAHKVIDTVLGQRDPLLARQWIAFLAGTAEQEVADRLARANQISMERRRRGLGKGTVYKPADVNNAAWPRARLSEHCRARRHLQDQDILLIGLCHASGLLHNVLDAAPAGTYEETVQQVYARLASASSVLAVLGAVESTVTTDASTLA